MNIKSPLEKNEYSKIVKSGALLFTAGVVALMGIITSEIFYPTGYSTSIHEISDLGSTRPPNSIIHQPSATIFNSVMIITGILISIASWFIHSFYSKFTASVPLGLFGFGILGVGIFPGNVEFYHGLFSMITFISGGIAAITSFLILETPFKYISIFLGVLSLILFFTAGSFIPILGMGGTERWVVYPLVLWITGFGGYLMGAASNFQINGE